MALTAQTQNKMSEFKVIKIVDYNKIQTQPRWKWVNRDGQTLIGDLVKINGFKEIANNETLKAFVIQRLQSLLSGNYVTFSSAFQVTGENAILCCNVILNGVNIVNYFPDIKKEPPHLL